MLKITKNFLPRAANEIFLNCVKEFSVPLKMICKNPRNIFFN